jgi:SPP1 family predicted phage head-tail adaptor
MPAGRLRHRIAITQPAESSDGAGGVTTTWSTLATLWGSIEPLRGREFLDAQGAQGEVSTKIVLRYRADITPKMRAVWSTHTYEINTVTFDPRRTYTELMCNEVD